MMRRHTLAIIIAGLAGGLLLLSLLSGFVPQADGPELRRKASGHIVHLRAEDMPEPIEAQSHEGRYWAVRYTVDASARPPQSLIATAIPAGSATQIVSFVSQGVILETSRFDIHYGAAEEDISLTPLLSMDGASIPLLTTIHPQRYGDTLDAHGHPLRWISEETSLTGYMPRTVDPYAFYDALWPVPSGSTLVKADHYRKVVESFSQRFDLDSDLILAIIQSESSFRPTLVSDRSAMGLMQLLPSTASGEIHRFLYGHSGDVDFEDLSVPETNIRYGTAYLHILMTRYFQDVRDPRSREYCVIAAYNMGPNRLLRNFGKNDTEAVARINEMDADELYEELTTHLPIRETRDYVAKVQRMKDYFAASLK